MQYQKALSRSNRRAALNQFITRCPNHRKVKSAQSLIEELADAENCEKCLREKSIRACQYYKTAHPNGLCISQANRILTAKLNFEDHILKAEDAIRREQEKKRNARILEEKRKQRTYLFKSVKSKVEGEYEAVYWCGGNVRGRFSLTLNDEQMLTGQFRWEDARTGRVWGAVVLTGKFDMKTRQADLRIQQWITRGGGEYYGSAIKFSESYRSFAGDHYHLKSCNANYRKR